MSSQSVSSLYESVSYLQLLVLGIVLKLLLPFSTKSLWRKLQFLGPFLCLNLTYLVFCYCKRFDHNGAMHPLNNWLRNSVEITLKDAWYSSSPNYVSRMIKIRCDVTSIFNESSSAAEKWLKKMSNPHAEKFGPFINSPLFRSLFFAFTVWSMTQIKSEDERVLHCTT